MLPAWRGPALVCKQGRTIHLRCLRGTTGETCFWEIDEGVPYDTCRTISADLARWCY